jgi:hypothetical protein
MGVNALFLVITENHILNFVLLVSGCSLDVLKILLQTELLNTITVNLELLVAEFVVGFVTRDD